MKKFFIFFCIFSGLILSGCQKGNESNSTTTTSPIEAKPIIEAAPAPDNIAPPPIKTKPIGPKRASKEDQSKVLSPIN